MGASLRDGLLFLISTVFNIYITLLIIRFVLACVGSNYATNPLTQFIVKCTSFVIKPMKKVIPDFRKIEFSTLLLIILLAIIKWTLILTIPFGFPYVSGLLILSFGDTLKLALQIFFFAILIQALITWIQPASSIDRGLNDFTSPVMKPIQRIIPPIGGFDISPVPALIILQLLIIVLVNPIIGYGLGMAHG
jgi:YggT family protein